jgi:hypothetical protein
MVMPETEIALGSLTASIVVQRISTTATLRLNMAELKRQVDDNTTTG